MTIDWPLTLLWSCWGAGWLLAATGVRPTERGEARSSRSVHVLLLAVSFALLFVEPLRSGPLARELFPGWAHRYPVGLSLAMLGLGFATWARIELGRNWSGAVAIKQQQSLIESGPYALVRHPIYTGILIAFVGSSIAIGSLGAAVAAAVALIAYWRKIRIEERWLRSAFGGEYERYADRVGPLLPFRRGWTPIRDVGQRSREQLTSSAELDRTIDRLCAEGQLSAQRADELRTSLPDEIEESSYILRNLGAHLAIGVIFAFDLVPLPLGTIARVLWVAGNRLYETAFGTPERARVHSVWVLLIAAIPWLGYAAYLLPLRSESHELSWLLAHHLSFRLHDLSFTDYLAEKPRFVQRAGAWLLPPID